MAYFIVIGTNNDVKGVVDEIKTAHLQHNVVTSGCVLEEGESLYYHWDVFNEKGDKTNGNKESITLHDALTNQIAHFRTLLPNDVTPNVFIVSKCFDSKESDTLQMVYKELCLIGGATMSGLQVDVILIGYDLKRAADVTLRPHWQILESLRGLEETGRFHTNVLYVNNMDYMGAATDVDSCLLGRFLCHWSKMICSGNPKVAVHSNVYSVGLAEHQYDFRDLNEFFKLSAEEILLDRTLNSSPSSDTQQLLDCNYYKKIDLGLHWIDGLCTIQSLWRSYCSTEWDPSKSLSNNTYSVARHEQELAVYLNSYLKLYVREEQREIDGLRTEILNKEVKLQELSTNLATYDAISDQTLIEEVQEEISRLKNEVSIHQNQIKVHEANISRNTFLDANEFYENFGTAERITEEDEAAYSSSHSNVGDLISYLKSDAGVNVMREAVERATTEDVLPQSYPAMAVINMGRFIEPSQNVDPTPSTTTNVPTGDKLSEKPGCLFWFKGLFGRREKEIVEPAPSLSITPVPISGDVSKSLVDTLNKSVAGLKKADDVRDWWETLCRTIAKHQSRRAECKLLMDGERKLNGEYVEDRRGYRPMLHRKSVSLIDMERVRAFRDTDGYYKQNIDKFLDRWFDRNSEPSQRMTMPELIKHQVLDPLVGRYHTLKWDGSNPFVKEDITDTEMHAYIEHDIRQSKPFVEYVRIQDSNITQNLNIEFYSNNPNIPVNPTDFRNRYHLSSNSITPVRLDDFVNSLCVVQVMDIPEHIDALKDYKPRREFDLNRMRTDIRDEVVSIIGGAATTEEKARAIYDWICENIAYDVTKQIHDAETCWNTRRGVCQAYSELFCYMAEAVGLTADVITGKTKNSKGEVSEDKHAWVFVYTHAYDGLLIDPTWGAGYVDNGKFVKNIDNSIWFDVSPYWMICSHYPDEQRWAKLDIEVSEEDFNKLPYTHPSNETDGKDFFFENVSRLNN